MKSRGESLGEVGLEAVAAVDPLDHVGDDRFVGRPAQIGLERSEFDSIESGRSPHGNGRRITDVHDTFQPNQTAAIAAKYDRVRPTSIVDGALGMNRISLNKFGDKFIFMRTVLTGLFWLVLSQPKILRMSVDINRSA